MQIRCNEHSLRGGGGGGSEGVGGGKLWNFKWRKGRWREKGETADNPLQIAEHKN